MNFKKILIAAGLILGLNVGVAIAGPFVESALAAEPATVTNSPTVIVSSNDWSGTQIGLNVRGLAADVKGYSTDDSTKVAGGGTGFTFTDDINLFGGRWYAGFGGHLNWVTAGGGSKTFFTFCGDPSCTDIGTHTYHANIRMEGSLVARLSYSPFDSVLVTADAGVHYVRLTEMNTWDYGHIFGTDTSYNGSNALGSTWGFAASWAPFGTDSLHITAGFDHTSDGRDSYNNGSGFHDNRTLSTNEGYVAFTTAPENVFGHIFG